MLFACVRTCVHIVYVRTCVSTCVYVCINEYALTCVSTCVRVHKWVCTNMCKYVCTCACYHICMCTYVRTCRITYMYIFVTIVATILLQTYLDIIKWFDTFLWQAEDGVDLACISGWAFKDSCRPDVRLDFEDERELSWLKLSWVGWLFFKKCWIELCTLYTCTWCTQWWRVRRLLPWWQWWPWPSLPTVNPTATVMITVWPWFHGPATSPSKSRHVEDFTFYFPYGTYVNSTLCTAAPTISSRPPYWTIQSPHQSTFPDKNDDLHLIQLRCVLRYSKLM